MCLCVHVPVLPHMPTVGAPRVCSWAPLDGLGGCTGAARLTLLTPLQEWQEVQVVQKACAEKGGSSTSVQG